MKHNHTPMRRCVGCMNSQPKDQLLRIGYKDGHLTVDETGRIDGRGTYICKNLTCLEQAEKRRAFNRAFKTAIDREDFDRIKEYLEK